MINKLIKYIGSNFAKPNGIGGSITTKIMNRMNQKQYNTLLKKIKLQPNIAILDVGFGNGYLINKLLEQSIPIKLFGIDISKDMVDYVSLKNKHYLDNDSLNLSLENISDTYFE